MILYLAIFYGTRESKIHCMKVEFKAENDEEAIELANRMLRELDATWWGHIVLNCVTVP